MEGDVCLPRTWLVRNRSFNPRPHMEGDLMPTFLGGISRVSIHALTWRATYVNAYQKYLEMFQSTPSHGGRLISS